MTGFTSKRQMAQDKAMNRPLESDYTSQVAYTRALEAYCDSLAQPEQEPDCQETGVCVRSRLYAARQPKQEPVAWAIYDKRGGSKSLHWPENHSPDGDATKFDAVPLYTTPPKRDLVRADEREQIIDEWWSIVQADLENGVKCLNEQAATKWRKEYPSMATFGEWLEARGNT